MCRLAVTTCAQLFHPYGHPTTEPFDKATPAVFASADEHPALLARADYADDRPDLGDPARNWGDWGSFAVPVNYTAGVTADGYRAAQTLSIWSGLAGLRDFVYSGLHVEALRRRGEWFERVAWPTYALWWIADDENPTWSDAARRLDVLDANGPTVVAFDFSRLFDAAGRPVSLRDGGVTLS